MVGPSDVVEHLRANDPTADAFGVEVLAADLDDVTIAATPTETHCNAHDIVHGGALFTLADIAMSYACNSGNEETVAAGASVEYLRPARAGNRLTVRAVRSGGAGRSAVYDATVIDGTEVVAVFRGRTRRLGGAHLP